MYLHEDREQFADVVRKSVQHTNMSEIIIEKDYYVTMILRLLSQKLPYVEMNENLKRLVKEVRAVRESSSICPSAQEDVDIPALLQLIIQQGVYKDDYKNLTEALLEEDIGYETAVQAIEKIRASGMFEKG